MSDTPPTSPAIPPERARIDPPPPPTGGSGALATISFVGVLVLAGAVGYLYVNPPTPEGTQEQTAKVNNLGREADAREREVDALSKRLAQVEARPMPEPPGLTAVENRVQALENKGPPDLGPVNARIEALQSQMREALGAVRSQADGLQTQQASVASAAEQAAKRNEARLGTVESEVAALQNKQAGAASGISDRLDQLDQQQKTRLAPLQSQVAALEDKQREAASGVSDQLETMDKQLKADVQPVQSKLDEVAGKLDQAMQRISALQSETGKLQERLGAAEAQAKQADSGLSSLQSDAQKFGQLQAATVALNAGKPLGEIKGAPSALEAFAQKAPPTEAGLRLSFDNAAEAAREASQPALTSNQNFLDRMWIKAQQAVTVRQGDQVIVGDPVSGVLQSAREKLDAGDLAGSVQTLGAGLAGPAKVAMTGWINQAQSLIDARAAIAQMAARG